MKKIKRKTINTESSEDVTHTNILKKEKGITLIALVVTIVVLLILAGVSINLVIGNNGIITKSKEARIVTRADNAEDEVELWKNNNYIAKNSNGSSESKNDMLQRLIDKKLVYEDEIDRNNEIITIKREDETIVKEINYGGVVIHISKTPETEEAGAVILKVTSVEGIETRTINSDEDFQKLFEDIEALDEETKKTSIKNLYPKFLNETEGTNFSTFTEVLQYLHEQGVIEANTEEAFWAGGNPENYSNIIMNWLEELYYDSTTGTLQTYIATNPDGETSNAYLATENGTYTFTVNDLLTGKNYTKSVEVANIVDGNITIDISKTPETEHMNAVLLQVKSVVGLTQISNETELNHFKEIVEAMNTNDKKELIKNLDIQYKNEFNGTNIKTFEELLEYYYRENVISDKSEEKYWELVNRRGSTYTELIYDWTEELFEYGQTKKITIYEIINPDNEISNAYLATENGTYTFTVNDLLTGKIYTKSVEVNNIDNNLNYYIGTVGYYGSVIALKDKNTEEPTTFEGAYIIFNGETIDITSLIQTNTDTEDDIPDGTTYIYDVSIADFLEDIGKINSYFDMEGEVVSVILIKDGAYYVGNIIIRNLPG